MRSIYPPLIGAIAFVLIASLWTLIPLHARADAAACARGDSGGANSIYGFQVDGSSESGTELMHSFAHGTILRITAFGSTRIDYWGTNKWPDGDNTLAPDDSFWPALGFNEYGLVVKPPRHTGTLIDLGTGASSNSSSWLRVGSFSDCLLVQSDIPSLIFQINDSKTDDNAGGPQVDVLVY